MDYQYITTGRDGHLFTLTINRPDVMNAISPAASHEMAHALDAFEADDELWVAIITGAGDAALVGALYDLLTDREAARRLGAIGQERVVERFASSVMADRTLAIWRDVLG